MKNLLILIMLVVAALPSPADIFEAARTGNLEEVKELLEKDPTLLNAVDDGVKAPPIFWASMYAQWDVVDYLLTKHPDAKLESALSAIALHGAAHHNRPDMMKKLLDYGFDINDRNAWGMTPLHLAVWRNCPDVVELLISEGTDKTIVTNEGWTPLHYANLCGRDELITYLLEQGFSPDAKDEKGRTPAELYTPRPAEVTDENLDLEEFTGSYRISPTFAFKVLMRNGTLILTDIGQEEMYYIGNDAFFCKQAPWRIEFSRNEQGAVEKVMVHFIRRSYEGTKE